MMRPLIFLFILIFSSTALANTKCIAHRGYHKDAPDNSLEAIQIADQLGADGIEFDIVHTQDGIAILNHDKSLKKTSIDAAGETCPMGTPVSDMTLEEIQAKCVLKNGATIPTLEDVMNQLAQSPTMVFLELKDMPTAHTSSLMKKYYQGKEEQLRVIAFSKKNIKGLKSNDKKFWKGVKFQKLMAQPFGVTRSMGVNVFIHAYKTRRKFFKRLNKKRELGIWTVNKESNLTMLMNDGVDFITTDKLETCLELK